MDDTSCGSLFLEKCYIPLSLLQLYNFLNAQHHNELLRPKSCCISAQSADENRAFLTSSSSFCFFFFWSAKWRNWGIRGFLIMPCCMLESRWTWDVHQFLYFYSFGIFALHSSVIRTFDNSRETIWASFYMTRNRLWCWLTTLMFFFCNNWRTLSPVPFATVQILHKQVPTNCNPTFLSRS